MTTERANPRFAPEAATEGMNAPKIKPREAIAAAGVTGKDIATARPELFAARFPVRVSTGAKAPDGTRLVWESDVAESMQAVLKSGRVPRWTQDPTADAAEAAVLEGSAPRLLHGIGYTFTGWRLIRGRESRALLPRDAFALLWTVANACDSHPTRSGLKIRITNRKTPVAAGVQIKSAA